MATNLTNTISIKQPMIEGSRHTWHRKTSPFVYHGKKYWKSYVILANMHVILKSNA